MTTRPPAYQVLARKWRPQKFAEVVGQEHVKRALRNAILHERVGHAYLFVGPRGIGKTTIARIFAKALNCEALHDAEPCCACQSCQEMAAGNSLDLIEIDAASNRGVDSIRNLREGVLYTPSRSRYKVYIIDEVHMLTKEAWNALLKTLEEPPPHVKFLFATTEPHKVLPTILSRCQRFDLRRIPVNMIAEHLRKIADTEKVFVEPPALVAIARAADGGMRDGQSIFDQMISFCGGRTAEESITEQDVIDVFGLASSTELHTLISGIMTNDPAGALHVLQELADQGRDLERVLSDAIQYTRDLAIRQICPDDSALVDAAGAEQETLDRLAGTAPPDVVQRVLEGLLQTETPLRIALNKRVSLEAAVVRIIRNAHGPKIEDVIARLAALQAGAPAPPQSSSPAPPPATARSAAAPPRPPAATKPAAPSPRPQPAPAPASPPSPPPAPAAAQETNDAPPRAPAVSEVRETPAKMTPSAPVDAAGMPPPDSPVEQPAGASSDTVERSAPASGGPERADAPPPRDEAPQPSETPPPAPPAASTQTPLTTESAAAAPAADLEPEAEPGPESTPAPAPDQNPAELWRHLIEEVGNIPEHHQLKLFLQELKPVSFIDGVLEVGVDDEVLPEHAEEIARPENNRIIQRCFSRVSPAPGGRVLVKRWIPGVSDNRRTLTRSPVVWEKLRKNPFVQQACSLLDARIIDVRG